MKVWVYQSRRDEITVYAEHNRPLARTAQNKDNGCTFYEAAKMGLEVSGDPESGDFSIDDGGSITLMEIV